MHTSVCLHTYFMKQAMAVLCIEQNYSCLTYNGTVNGSQMCLSLVFFSAFASIEVVTVGICDYQLCLTTNESEKNSFQVSCLMQSSYFKGPYLCTQTQSLSGDICTIASSYSCLHILEMLRTNFRDKFAITKFSFFQKPSDV